MLSRPRSWTISAGGSRHSSPAATQIGALPILIVPPANEAGYEPGRSTVSPSVPANERLRLVDEFKEARAKESRDSRASAASYAAILERHPSFAEAHFRLARLLEGEGRAAEAGPHYLAALDNDGLPLRCQAPFRAAFPEVAKRHPRSILIDGRRELMAVSPNGLIGDHVIYDTHHPTLRGLSGGLADAGPPRWLRTAQGLPPPASRSNCQSTRPPAPARSA